jgi:RNA polymerase sigma-54 factor
VKPALQLRLSQHLTLTPQLQQSIRLLQLSTVELNQEIEQALAENPILEREEGDAHRRSTTTRRPSSRRPGRAARTTATATAAFRRTTHRHCATI